MTMDKLILISGLAGIFFFALLTTGLIRKYSLKNALIDIPNERSSHSIPTTRGGGLSIALSILLVIGLLFFAGWIAMEFALALGIGGLIVVIIGWIDDHRHIPALWRAISYFIAAGWAIVCLGGLERIQLGSQVLFLGHMGTFLAIFWIVWLTNLYNFMDGTDSMAAIQAICVGLLAGILFWLEGQYGVAIVCFVIAASSCGFLFWNWPPAKIFMGDVGSCTLGFCFGVLAVIGEIEDTVPLVVWFILLAIFICDATFTLLMRIGRNEKWYQAHKSHAYQRLVQLGMSHKQLAIVILIVNISILWPLAWLAYQEQALAFYIACLAGLLMATLWGMIQIRYHNSILSER